MLNEQELILEIRFLYEEIIKRCNKINKLFELHNPIEIYNIYTYLLFRGYLSNNKEFNITDEKPLDIRILLGSNIINGQGVCRHTSSMLTDTENNYGFRSYNISVSNIIPTIKFNSSSSPSTPKKSKEYTEKMLNRYYLGSEEEKNELLNKYSNSKDHSISIENKDLYSILLSIIGNHALTLTTYHNKKYLFDSNNCNIYTYDSNTKRIINTKKSHYKVCSLASYIKYGTNPADITTTLKLPDPKEEEIENHLKRSTIIYLKNQDIFNTFYEDNKDIYKETSSKIKILKKTLKQKDL